MSCPRRNLRINCPRHRWVDTKITLKYRENLCLFPRISLAADLFTFRLTFSVLPNSKAMHCSTKFYRFYFRSIAWFIFSSITPYCNTIYELCSVFRIFSMLCSMTFWFFHLNLCDTKAKIFWIKVCSAFETTLYWNKQKTKLQHVTYSSLDSATIRRDIVWFRCCAVTAILTIRYQDNFLF